MPIIVLLALICIVSFQAANLAAWWTVTWVDVGTALSMIRKVNVGAISTASFMVRRATPAMRKGLISGECCS